jgi:hypothetical protein
MLIIRLTMALIGIPSQYKNHGLHLVRKNDGDIYYSQSKDSYLAVALSNMSISITVTEDAISFDTKCTSKSKVQKNKISDFHTSDDDDDTQNDIMCCPKCSNKMQIQCNCAMCCNSENTKSYTGSSCNFQFKCNDCNPSNIVLHKGIFIEHHYAIWEDYTDRIINEWITVVPKKLKRNNSVHYFNVHDQSKHIKQLERQYKLMMSQRCIVDDDEFIDRYYTERIVHGNLQYIRNFVY